jgi:thiol-disulfide isomerase/thioredoxin
MLKLFSYPILMLLTLFSFAQAAEVNQQMVIDQKILDLPITLVSGQTVTLNQYKGNKSVYLKFWASWCRSCLKQMPHLQQTYKKYGDKVQVIAVNLGINDDLKSVAAIQKKFGLSMPIAIDKSGALAKAFNLIGTPYHVLLDKNSSVVYAGYEEATDLDKFIKLVAAGHTLNTAQAQSASTAPPIDLASIAEKPTALFFVATWCDWYLKDSRPAVSKSCVGSQKQVNKLAAQYPQVNWVGVVSRLWTEDKDVVEYKKKFNVQHSLAIDSTNNVFLDYNVKDIPTLILLNKGKEVFRTQHVDANELSAKLKQLVVQK